MSQEFIDFPQCDLFDEHGKETLVETPRETAAAPGVPTPDGQPRRVRLPYQRYKIVMQYDGQAYNGFQRQVHARKPESPTVQLALENALNKLFVSRMPIGIFGKHRYIVVHGSSRTDSGVHAIESTAHFALCKLDRRTGNPIALRTLEDNTIEYEQYDEMVLFQSINQELKYQGEKVRIVRIERKSNKYHSRYAAIRRTYMYRILVNVNVEFPLLGGRAWFLSMEKRLGGPETGKVPIEVNVEAMRAACKLFVGTHDFSAFCSTMRQQQGRPKISPVKTIESCTLEIVNNVALGEPFMPATTCFQGVDPYEIRIFVTAPSFLYHQIRLMVYMLAQIGLGNYPPEFVSQLLAAKQRTDVTQHTAPSDGLYLLRVEESEGKQQQTSTIQGQDADSDDEIGGNDEDESSDD